MEFLAYLRLKKTEFLIFLYIIAFKSSFSAELGMKKVYKRGIKLIII